MTRSARHASRIAVLALLILSCPAIAMAAAGVNLRWTSCFGDGGAIDRTSACDSNAGSAGALVASYQLAGGISGVTGIEGVVDLVAAGAALPAWWDLSAPGGTVGCRGTAMLADATIPASSFYCSDWAGGLAVGGLAAYRTADNGTVLPTHRRVLVGFAVSSAVDVIADVEYFAFRITLSNAKTTDPGGCAGCTVPVCLVLNSVHVVPGLSAGVLLGSGTLAGSNVATWQSSSGSACAVIPTQKRTWSEVKSLYH